MKNIRELSDRIRQVAYDIHVLKRAENPAKFFGLLISSFFAFFAVK
jgi:hypothetical protein